MKEYTVKTKLLAKKEGIYTTYVFQNLDTEEYIMCTKPPDWQTDNIEINEEGFLYYKEILAGEEYYDWEIDNKKKYKYSNLYFINFIKITNITKQEIIL